MLKHITSIDVVHRGIVHPDVLPKALYNSLLNFWRVTERANLSNDDICTLYLLFVRQRDNGYMFSQMWRMDNNALTRMLRVSPEGDYSEEELPLQVKVSAISHYLRGAMLEQETKDLEQTQFVCAISPAFSKGVIVASFLGMGSVDAHLYPVESLYYFSDAGVYVTVTLSPSFSFSEIVRVLRWLTDNGAGWKMYLNERRRWGDPSFKLYILKWFDTRETSGWFNPLSYLSGVLFGDVSREFPWVSETVNKDPECQGRDDVERVAALLIEGKESLIYFREIPPIHEMDILPY